MMKKILHILFFYCLVFTGTVHAQLKNSDDFFNRLNTERIVSDNTVDWQQVAPGNAGFANLLRYHPTIPELIVQCPDMWNIYQSHNNGTKWTSMKDWDGNGDFFHIRDLYYSPSNPNFGLAIESSRMWKTEDLGVTWTYLANCPWYDKDNNGFDTKGWLKKVASLGMDPNNTDVWFVGGGANVRGQEWLSCYQEMTEGAPHGLETTGYEGMIWRTTNGGDSWTLVNNGMHADAQVGRIIVNPMNSQQVFASSNYGLYRSNDGGTNWTNISSGQLDNEIIMDMDFYYNADDAKFILYAIDQVQYHADGQTTKCSGGIFKSSDNGDSWQNISGNLGLDYNQLSGGAPYNYYKYIAYWFGKTVSEVQNLYPSLPENAMQIFNMISADPSREDAVYIGFADPQTANSIVPGRLWTTSNGGEHWISTARLYEHVWAADKDYWESRNNPYHENMVVGHESPHMQSGDDYALRSMRGMDVGVDGSVMIISDHSTMLSTDHGVSWQQVDEYYTPSGAIVGRGNSNLPALTIAQDKRYETAVLGSGEHRIWIPTDDGDEGDIPLKFIESAQPTVITMAFDPFDSKKIFGTSSRQEFKQYIFRSDDGGYHWQQHGVATPATNAWLDDFYTNALTIDPVDNNYFYFGITDIVDVAKGDQGGFFYSDDAGKSFQQSNIGLPNPCRIKDIVFDPRDDSRKSLFIAAEKNAFSYYQPLALGGLYHSNDRGQNWTKVNTPSAVQGVNYIAIDNTNRMYITTGYRGAGNGAWYTDDFGDNWTQIFSYAGAECIDVSPFDNNLLVLTVEYLAKNPGVFVSRDRGITWVKANKHIASPNHIEDVKFDILDPSEIWLATLGSGFYKGKIENGEQVQVVKLDQKSIEYSSSTNTQLTASIVNTQYADEIITWKSDNPSVVTVDETGKISAVARGNTKVWASAVDGRFTDYCVVIVNDIENSVGLYSANQIKIIPTLIKDTFSAVGAKPNSVINIYSIKGTKIFTTKKTTNVDVSNLEEGMYIVEVISSGTIVKQKIVKK